MVASISSHAYLCITVSPLYNSMNEIVIFICICTSEKYLYLCAIFYVDNKMVFTEYNA